MFVIGGPILVHSKVADFWTGMLQAFCVSTNHFSVLLASVLSAYFDRQHCSYASRSSRETWFAASVITHRRACSERVRRLWPYFPISEQITIRVVFGS